ncbi:MAG: EAL domain-containing protein [Oculatellaceae cyanobacterium Prado106]|jgi:diguanylate cyclase (GGDEF)-like protein/PAS domain S-box-containing protein|nr:EAL domain-containing protein [Oculatellaceae cyanobacterium Prado106]
MLAVSLTLTSLVGLLYATTAHLITKGYAALEQQDMQHRLEQFLNAYQHQLADQSFYTLNQADLGEMLAFVDAPEQHLKFVNDSLMGDALIPAKVSVLLLLDGAGQVVYGGGFQKSAKQSGTVHLEQFVQANPAIRQFASTRACHQGLVMLPKTPMLVVSCPISDRQLAEPIQGTFVTGQAFDQTAIRQFADADWLNIQVHRLDVPSISIPANAQIAYGQMTRQTPIAIHPKNQQTISGYVLLRDYQDRPALMVQVEMPRHIYQQGQQSLVYLAIALAAIGLAFAVSTQFLAERILHFWRKQQDSQARYRSVVAQASEGICLVDAETLQFLEANLAFQTLLGYRAPEILHLTLDDVALDDGILKELQHSEGQLQSEIHQSEIHQSEIHQSEIHQSEIHQSEIHQSEIQNKFQDGSGDRPRLIHEQRFRSRSGNWIDVEVSASLMQDSGRQVICLVVRDVTQRKQTEAALQESQQQLFWQARHDDLTHLVNRRGFEQCLELLIQDARVHHRQHSLCYFDLDQFKIINDTCGHRVGDELLRQVTALLKTKVRNSDVLARLGGDEFGLLLHHCPPEQGLRVADMLRQSLQNFRFVWQDKVFTISVSIGLVTLDDQSPDLASVLSAADAACYVAKAKGRNRIHVYQPDDDELAQQQSEMQWVGRITKALEEERFCLYYQSIASTGTDPGSGEHYEVLLRLHDEAGHLVAPGVFLPSAERYNLMNDLDRWVIQTLFQTQGDRYRQCWQRSQQENYECLFAINLSGASINDDQFIGFLLEQFRRHHIPPQVICFEITETVAIANLSKALHFIQVFKQLGCRFALDDFGSGMSSFAYLKNLPVDYLKIDGSFVKDILKDPTHLAMVEAINQVGHVMGLQTIAEFVEDQGILEQLRAIGVDFAQGYGIAKPRPLEMSCHLATSVRS